MSVYKFVSDCLDMINLLLVFWTRLLTSLLHRYKLVAAHEVYIWTVRG